MVQQRKARCYAPSRPVFTDKAGVEQHGEDQQCPQKQCMSMLDEQDHSKQTIPPNWSQVIIYLRVKQASSQQTNLHRRTILTIKKYPQDFISNLIHLEAGILQVRDQQLWTPNHKRCGSENLEAERWFAARPDQPRRNDQLTRTSISFWDQTATVN